MNRKKNLGKMSREIQEIRHDLGRLSNDAHGLIAATVNVADGKVTEARERLANALEHGRKSYGRVRDLAVAGTREASEAVHRHPYQALGVGLGIAALLGYLIVRRCSSDDD